MSNEKSLYVSYADFSAISLLAVQKNNSRLFDFRDAGMISELIEMNIMKEKIL